MKHKAFSLVEVVTVVAILSVVMAIVSPTIWRAKEAANISSSMSRLRQLGMAVQIYQTNEGTDGPRIDALPTSGYVYSTFMGFGRDFFVSPCGHKNDIEPNVLGISYLYWGGFEKDQWLFDDLGDNSPLFMDPDCNVSGDQWNSMYRSKRGLAVLYSGQVVNLYKPGDPYDPHWWVKK